MRGSAARARGRLEVLGGAWLRGGAAPLALGALLVLGALQGCRGTPRPPELGRAASDAPRSGSPRPAGASPTALPVGEAPVDGGRALPGAGGPTPQAAELRCERDADCAVTLLPASGCCPRSCTARAIRAVDLARLEQACEGAPSAGCPERVCPPPSYAPSPACERGRCAVRLTPLD